MSSFLSKEGAITPVMANHYNVAIILMNIHPAIETEGLFIAVREMVIEVTRCLVAGGDVSVAAALTFFSHPSP